MRQAELWRLPRVNCCARAGCAQKAVLRDRVIALFQCESLDTQFMAFRMLTLCQGSIRRGTTAKLNENFC